MKKDRRQQKQSQGTIRWLEITKEIGKYIDKCNACQ